MKKITFGTPEQHVPSRYCKGFNYVEKEVKYPVDEIEFFVSRRGANLVLPLYEDEQIYGMGLQLKQFNHRGRKLTCRVNSDPVSATGDSHAPVPFFVSTRGYGIYVDTARYAEFYFGSSKLLKQTVRNTEAKIADNTEELYTVRAQGLSNISINIPYAEGVDIYIIEGENLTDIIAQYNMLSGGGCDVPEWGLEPIYRCYTKFCQDDILRFAKLFKEKDIPIGIIGLEPGWQTRAYSCSYVWSDERYPDHVGLINELKSMGYHINLWEHAFTHPTSPIYDELVKFGGNYAVWEGCVPDFSFPEARKIFADHQRKIVSEGIDGFKLDECDSSDYARGWSFPNMSEFPSGMDGEQYHNMFGVLYMQAMLEALGDTPTLSEVRSAGALSASYPFVLYSDLYDHKDFIRGLASSGFSGILWTPEVRVTRSKEELLRRLQSNVFSVQCLLNIWFWDNTPWANFDCEDEVRELLKLRYTLIPMLKKAFEQYKSKGIPPIRALVCDYTNDANTYNIDDQYIFCDKLIVAPIASGMTGRDVYLPEGKWVDYFTKEPVECGKFHVETDFIPVYEKVED